MVSNVFITENLNMNRSNPKIHKTRVISKIPHNNNNLEKTFLTKFDLSSLLFDNNISPKVIDFFTSMMNKINEVNVKKSLLTRIKFEKSEKIEIWGGRTTTGFTVYQYFHIL